MNGLPPRCQSSFVVLHPSPRRKPRFLTSVQMAEFVTTIPEGSNGMALNIKLHSPSSAIIGTPLDPSSRFEYPFPSPQLEYQPTNSIFHAPHATHSSSLSVGSYPSSRQRQSHVHPKHEVREVPVPPTLDKRVNIELRFPRPTEGANVLGQAQTSKRRTDAGEMLKKS